MISMPRAAAPARLARHATTGLTAAAAATLVAFSFMAAPAGASAPGSATAIPGALAAVSCPATNACWAVGTQATLTSSSAVVAQWDGSAWSAVSIPFPSGAQSTKLTSVSCPSTTLCWAVGWYGTSAGATLPYVLEWNGTAWSTVTLPRPPKTTDMVGWGVSCSSTADCWEAQFGGSGPRVEHWNGTAWTMVAAPALGLVFQPDLSCISVSDCWMVGPHKSRGGTYAARWNGSSWSLVQTPTSHEGSHLLSGISCRGKACVAVGDNGAPGAGKGVLAERWNGSVWTVNLTGGSGTSSAFLNAVSCPAGGSCLAVGARARGAHPGAFSERWTGSRWHSPVTPTPAGNSQLMGVSCVTASDCWAVGDTGANPATSLFEHWNGTAWSIVS